VLNFGTRDAFLNDIYANRAVFGPVAASNWIRPWFSDSALRVGDFILSGGSLTNARTVIPQTGAPVAITYSSESNQIVVDGGDLMFVKSPQIQSPSFLATDKVRPYTRTWGHDLTFSSNMSRIRHASSSGSSTVTLYNDTIELTTQGPTSEPPEGVKPVVVQLSVDSNGQCFVRSNVSMQGRAVVRAYTSPSIDDDYFRESVLTLSSNAMAFATRSNLIGTGEAEYQRLFGVNQYGAFLVNKFSVFGKNELLQVQNPSDPLGPPINTTTFARLDCTLNDGLVYGLGISNDIIAPASYNVFNVKRNGELYLRDALSTQMRMCFDSNARLSKGSLLIDNDGVLSIAGSPLVTNTGAIVRRSNLDDPTGFQVSPNGFVTVGSTLVLPDGRIQARTDITTTSNLRVDASVTACNLFTSNLRVDQAITASNLIVASNLQVNAFITASNIRVNQSITASNLIVACNLQVDASVTACNLNVANAASLCNLSTQRVTVTQQGDHLAFGTGSNRTGVGTYLGGMTRLFGTGADVSSVRLSAASNANQTGAGATFSDFLTVITGPPGASDRGHVSIGTVVPLSRLDVNGEIRELGSNLRERYAPSNATVGLSNSWYTSSNQLFGATNTASGGLLALSNAFVATSNALFPRASFGSNAAAWASNQVPTLVASDQWTSNVAVWSSNAATTALGVSTSALVTAQWASNAHSNVRRTNVQVPWADISGKPDFDGNSVGVGGVVLGSAGLLFGGAALLNQNGQLVGNLTDTLSRFLVRPDGFARFNDTVQVGNQANNTLRMRPDSIEMGNETTPLLRFNVNGISAPAARIGFGTVAIEDQTIAITNTGRSNVHITSGPSSWFMSNVGVGTSNPTERLHVNGNAIVTSSLAIGSSTVGTAPLTVSAWIPQGGAVLQGNLTGSSFLTSTQPTEPIWLARVTNTNIVAASNPLWGGVLLRWYNSVGTAPYAFADRQTIGMGFVVRNGTSSNTEALTLRHDGNVGVGTSNPMQRLDVVGNALVSGTVSEQGSNLATRYAASNQVAALSGNFVAWSNALSNQVTTRQLTITSGGQAALSDGDLRLRAPTDSSNSLRYDSALGGPNLFGSNGGGLGTSATSTVLRWTNNTVQLRSMDAFLFKDANHGIRYDTAQDGPSVFGWNGGRLNWTGGGGGTALAWNNQGRVGIGLTNPSDRLHVSGNTIVTGTISEQGALLASRYGASNTMAAIGVQAAFGSNQAVTATNIGVATSNSWFASSNTVFSVAATGSNLAVPLQSLSNSFVGFSNAVQGKIDSDKYFYHSPFAGAINGAIVAGAVTQCNVFADGWFVAQHSCFVGADLATGASAMVAHATSATTTECALRQSMDGETFLNAAPGKTVNLGVGGTTFAYLDSNVWRADRVVAMGGVTAGPGVLMTNAFVGTMQGSNLGVAHFKQWLDAPSTGFALTQDSGGATILNSAAGRDVRVRVGGNDRLTAMSNGGIGVAGNCVVAGDLIMVNRGALLSISPGLNQGAGNANVTQYEMPGTGLHLFWDNVQVTGAFSAASKSFRIPHPLRDAHDLVHMSVEAPKADLMYRGEVQLSKGEAEVDIDAACGMTPDTFQALTKDPCCFVQNQGSFEPVMAAVEGGKVRLRTKSRSCTDRVSWMVVACRRDISFDIEPTTPHHTRASQNPST
jgi:hypothetical protein